MEKLNIIYRLAELIAKERTGNFTNEDKEFLDLLLNEGKDYKKIYEKLKNSKDLIRQINELKSIDTKNAYEKVEKKISLNSNLKIRALVNFWKYAAAAVVLITSTFLIIQYISKTQEIPVSQISLLPGRQRAVLITASNHKLYLDRSIEKRVIEDHSVSILQSGSTLSYATSDSTKNNAKEVLYNTLITPRGGEYKLVLSDGTEVYLNAESKIIFPVAFNGNTRQISLEGEAFFKVSKSEKPFIVNSDEMKIKVYGTKFNVHAYKNESLAHATLVEGSVGVQSAFNNREQRLIPNQQLKLNKSLNSIEISNVDVENYISWTEGKFVFENEPVENIIKTLVRWYDFNYEFQNEDLKNQRFTISVGRYENISSILNLISLSSDLQFALQNNTIIVNSK